MSTIRKIDTVNPVPNAPQFPAPADEQYPGAQWHAVFHPARGALWVCTLGGAPTHAEIDAILAPSQDVRAGCTIDAADRLQFEVLFDLENRMRALEAKPAITRAQYRNALIAAWKTLNS